MTVVNHTVANHDVIRRRLTENPTQFEFFQAVRLLQWLALDLCPSPGNLAKFAVGFDTDPSDEVVRFRALPALSFPQGQLGGLKWNGAVPRTGDGQPLAEITVAFLGLTGPGGALPQHYTQLLIDRTRHKDFALRDFFDLFNHRFISHFYRAWAKYRLPILFEQARFEDQRASRVDTATRCFYSFVGWETDSLRSRLEIPDQTFLYYAGHFAHFPRNAISLEAIVSDFFSIEGKVLQFRGQWLYLEQSDQSRMPSGNPNDLNPMNNQLGVTAIVGDRVWGVESKICIRIGPLGYCQFVSFCPSGQQFTKLGQLVRSYVGPALDIDAQLVLKKDEVPTCKIGGDDSETRLGWNTWLFVSPFTEDPDDTIFAVEGQPTGTNNRNQLV